MPVPSHETVRFKRNHFSTRLPERYLYTLSHFWLAEESPGAWRVGLTGFAARMLGDIVEVDFEREPGSQVEVADVIGWIEGFKAVSDVFCVAAGAFEGANPLAVENTDVIGADFYDRGWLYKVRGRPDPGAVDVKGYIEHLERTIDKMLERPWKSAEVGGLGSETRGT